MKKKTSKKNTSFIKKLTPQQFKKIGLSVASIVVTFMLVLYFMPRPLYREGFVNLAELKAYAEQYPEIVPMSNDNTLRPEFDQHYAQFKPTLSFVLKEKLHYLGTFFKITKRPVFSPSFFQHVITTLTKERKSKGFYSTESIICRVKATPATKCIIWGNIQASYHSLVRSFEQLKTLGIIDETLKFIQPDTYAFFTGNVVSRSNYSMETMAAVARFTQINPDRAFYLQGNHERDNYWQEHTLKTELQIRAGHLSQQPIPLEKEVNDFFSTLPEAAYISLPEDPYECIRISYAPRAGKTSRPVLNEQNYATFLTDPAAPTVSYKIVKQGEQETPPTQPIKIRVIFRDEKKRESYQPMEGLRFLAPDIDSVAWNILSCPNYVYQRAIKFKHDAFVILEANADINNWKLTLYSRDVTTQEPFKATPYNLLSGVNLLTNKQLEVDAPKKTPKSKEDKKVKAPRSLIPTNENTPIIPPPATTPPSNIQTHPAPATTPLLPPPPHPIQQAAPLEQPNPVPATAPTPHEQKVHELSQEIEKKHIGNKLVKTLETINATMLKVTSTLERIENHMIQKKENK
ncbi:MAG: hypothetical protein US69_C0021G0009 [candidate division TM6 bacterium GW2011_GWF2_38_10]|nr:MAG: hypothetical protein US69_C0021G0009 [candidate division TM6 bacterium GW2011_GWF2_38_10]